MHTADMKFFIHIILKKISPFLELILEENLELSWKESPSSNVSLCMF